MLRLVKVDFKAVLLFPLQSAVVEKTWIECIFVAKALNLSMRSLRKHELSMKLSRESQN